MDLIFLGTSSGTPTKARNVSGVALLEDQGKGWYLIDCGEATQHQLLHTPLTLHGLRAVFGCGRALCRKDTFAERLYTDLSTEHLPLSMVLMCGNALSLVLKVL